MAAHTAYGGNDNIYESVEELRMKLETMRRLMENEDDEGKGIPRRKRQKCKDSIINGNVLSFVFIFILFLIICVSFYAFTNLYYAVLKKFPSTKHTEL